MMKRVAIIALSLVVVLVVTVAAGAAEPIRLITARPGWQHGLPWFASEIGAWERHGVDVRHTSLNSSGSVIEAFAAGQGDIAIINASIAINAYLRGVPMKVIAGVPISDYVAFAVDPSIQSLEDLKGKRIAVWNIPSDGSLALEHVVRERYGYQLNRDFTYVLVPASNICVTVQRGDADAAVVFEPYASACVLEGAHRLGPAGTISFDPPKLVQSSVIVANSNFLRRNPDTVRAFLAAADEVMRYMAEHGDEAVSILAKYSGEALDAVAASYEDVEFTVGIDLDFHRVMLDTYFEAQMLTERMTEEKIRDLYDLSYLP